MTSSTAATLSQIQKSNIITSLPNYASYLASILASGAKVTQAEHAAGDVSAVGIVAGVLVDDWHGDSVRFVWIVSWNKNNCIQTRCTVALYALRWRWEPVYFHYCQTGLLTNNRWG